MTYRVIATARARHDVDVCFNYIASKNPAGAVSWIDAYEQALQSLQRDPHRGLAPESESFTEPIREKIFKTRQGRSYRILFVVRDDTVFVIHVRGPGQELMTHEEMELPPKE
jgi:plasmid stabilization system protein ParE